VLQALITTPPPFPRERASALRLSSSAMDLIFFNRLFLFALAVL
jgi:hypothetical protein